MKQLDDMTEPELLELMIAMGKQIDAVCAVMEVERPLFALLLFNDPRITQYVTNCRREDIIVAMRETANRLSPKQDVS